MSAEHPRYRVEGNDHVVDIQVGAVERLFDNRDPAPFRERDLDPDLVEYLVDAAEDLQRVPMRLVLWFTPPVPGKEGCAALKSQFEYELERIDRRRRQQRRIGQASLAIGLVLLVVLLSIAQFVDQLPIGGLRGPVHEGLVIISWVTMWRPIDTLVFDWVPLRRSRRLIQRLHDAPSEVREGRPY
jgi:hypothetical protein